MKCSTDFYILKMSQFKEGIKMEAKMWFDAPWGDSVKWTTSLVTIIFMFMILLEIITDNKHSLIGMLAMIVLPLSIMFLAIIFSVRGYSVTDNEILVHRLVWSNRFSINNISGVTIDNQAMADASRIGGNGGLFSFTGNFKSVRIGNFRALLTDPHHTVVMELKDGKKIVLSPGNADRFVQAVSEAILKNGHVGNSPNTP